MTASLVLGYIRKTHHLKNFFIFFHYELVTLHVEILFKVIILKLYLISFEFYCIFKPLEIGKDRCAQGTANFHINALLTEFNHNSILFAAFF